MKLKDSLQQRGKEHADFLSSGQKNIIVCTNSWQMLPFIVISCRGASHLAQGLYGGFRVLLGLFD